MEGEMSLIYGSASWTWNI